MKELIKIMTTDGEWLVLPNAKTKHFAIHHPGGRTGLRGRWIITHLNTGFRIPLIFPTLRKALAIAEALEAQRGTSNWGKWHLGEFNVMPSARMLSAGKRAIEVISRNVE